MWEGALKLLKELIGELGLKPDAISRGAAMGACSKGAKWERALTLLRDVELEGPLGLLNNNVTIHNVGVAACSDGNMGHHTLALLNVSHVLQNIKDPDDVVLSLSSALGGLERSWQRSQEAGLWVPGAWPLQKANSSSTGFVSITHKTKKTFTSPVVTQTFQFIQSCMTSGKVDGAMQSHEI